MTDDPAPAGGDAQQWAELQRLFHLLDGTLPADRERVLLDACADAALRTRVAELLAAADDAPQVAAPKEPAPAFAGPYRLVRQIGAGGIGTVYLAERFADGAVIRAALKLLAPYAVDSSFLERFHREQQNLAALDHPNITRLLDAGWTDAGQPYLVMEYIDGRHVDA
jgi:serine/threonine-protein kinase